VQTSVGGVEDFGAVERQPQNVVVAPLEENVLEIGIIHEKPLVEIDLWRRF
jgi:hypothetical protein